MAGQGEGAHHDQQTKGTRAPLAQQVPDNRISRTHFHPFSPFRSVG